MPAGEVVKILDERIQKQETSLEVARRNSQMARKAYLSGVVDGLIPPEPAQTFAAQRDREAQQEKTLQGLWKSYTESLKKITAAEAELDQLRELRRQWSQKLPPELQDAIKQLDQRAGLS